MKTTITNAEKRQQLVQYIDLKIATLDSKLSQLKSLSNYSLLKEHHRQCSKIITMRRKKMSPSRQIKQIQNDLEYNRIATLDDYVFSLEQYARLGKAMQNNVEETVQLIADLVETQREVDVDVDVDPELEAFAQMPSFSHADCV